MDFFVKLLMRLFGVLLEADDRRKLRNEYGATAPCPHCGRINSASTRICPRCENRLEE